MRRPTLCRVSTLELAPEATRLGAKDTREDRMVTDSTRDLETEETGLNLFDDSASAAGSFPHAMLGYDKHSVDSYVREVEAKVSQLKLAARLQPRDPVRPLGSGDDRLHPSRRPCNGPAQGG